MIYSVMITLDDMEKIDRYQKYKASPGAYFYASALLVRIDWCMSVIKALKIPNKFWNVWTPIDDEYILAIAVNMIWKHY